MATEKKTVKKQKVVVNKNLTEEEILKLDDGKHILVWDEKSLPELSDECQQKLGFYTMRDYLIAMQHKRSVDKQREQEEAGVVKVTVSDPYGELASGKLSMLPKDTETVHYTAQPPSKVDDFKALGFETTKGTDGKTDRVKYEGKDDLIFLKGDKKTFEQHLTAMSEQSRAMTRRARKQFVDNQGKVGVKGVDNSEEGRLSLRKGVLSSGE